MSVAATVQVARVETKPTAKGTVYKIFDQNGLDYATFKADVGQIAQRMQGRPALITFTEKQTEKDGRVYTNRYLDSIEEAAAQEPISQTSPVTGAADWDVIGLRKTRCALWAAYLRSPLAAHVAAAASADDDRSNAVYNVGRNLVELAEFDVYTRPNPDPDADPGIPF